MKEYWVNVYEHGEFGNAHETKEDCIISADDGRLSYRIYVKMKEVKPRDRKHYRPLDRDEFIKNWME